MLWPVNKSIVISRDVIFDETISPGLSIQKEGDKPTSNTNPPPTFTLLHVEETEPNETLHPHVATEPTQVNQPCEVDPNENPNSPEADQTTPDVAPSENQMTIPYCCSTRQRNPVDYWALNDPFLRPRHQLSHKIPLLEGAPEEISMQVLDFAFEIYVPEDDANDELAYGIVADQNDNLPETFIEAMMRPDGPKWWKATDQEFKLLLENGTWELVELPPSQKAIGSRWVFRIKRKANGEIERYKARLVAKGYSQRPGIDYDEVLPRWLAGQHSEQFWQTEPWREHTSNW